MKIRLNNLLTVYFEILEIIHDMIPKSLESNSNQMFKGNKNNAPERMMEWKDVKVSVNVPNKIREFKHDENPLVTKNACRTFWYKTTVVRDQKPVNRNYENPTTSSYRPANEESAKRALKRSSSGTHQRYHGSKRGKN